MLERLIAEQTRRAIFEEVDIRYEFASDGEPKKGLENFAPNFVDCPLRYNDENLSLRQTIFGRFVEPIAREAANITEGRSIGKATPMSAILFGPPGTSKTELTKTIAEYLGWPRLVVDPSYFVKKGMDNIQAQADKLFTMLSVTERIVVLLDEFDEMVRDRSSAVDVLSRFLTTAMLPKLATINKVRKLVFLVATNYIGSFDLAISRRGRFDLVIQVMPPLLDAKLKVARWQPVEDELQEFNLKNNAHVASILEMLTYDEFDDFMSSAQQATNADAFIRIAEDFGSKSTLRSQASPDGGGQVTSWEAVSTDQQKKIRLPEISNA